MAVALNFLLRVGPILAALYRLYAETRRNPMTDEEKKKLEGVAAGLAEEFKAIKEDLGNAKTLKDKIALIPDVVRHVEAANAKLKLAGAQKRELAIMVLNKAIDVPYVPENIEAIFIGLAIDAVVAAFNKYGKDWLSKLIPSKP